MLDTYQPPGIGQEKESKPMESFMVTTHDNTVFQADEVISMAVLMAAGQSARP